MAPNVGKVGFIVDQAHGLGEVLGTRLKLCLMA